MPVELLTRLRVPDQLLLVTAMVLLPFTELRIGLLGIGEVLILIVFLHQSVSNVNVSLLGEFRLTTFWLLFICASIFGLAVNAVLVDKQTGSAPSMAFDLSAYLVVLAACFSLERLATHSDFDVKRFTTNCLVWSGLVFSALYAVSTVSDSIAGMPLRYYGRFVPLADNLHQISMYLVPLPFLCLACLTNERSRGIRAILIVLIPAFLLMVVETGSAKAVLAIGVGATSLALSYLVRKTGRLILLQINVLLGIGIVMIFYFRKWIAHAIQLFEIEDVAGARGELYRRSIDLILTSPLIGRGPGPHVFYDGEFKDAHQTLLTILLQTGLVGLTAFLILIIVVFQRARHSPALIAAFLSILVYAAGGDILRRLPAWIMIFMIMYFAEVAKLNGSAIPKRESLQA